MKSVNRAGLQGPGVVGRGPAAGMEQGGAGPPQQACQRLGNRPATPPDRPAPNRPWIAGKVSADEYLVSQLHDASPATKAAIQAFRMPAPLEWADYAAVTLASMVLADRDGDRGLNRDEFYDFLSPEGEQRWCHARCRWYCRPAATVPLLLLSDCARCSRPHR